MKRTKIQVVLIIFSPSGGSARQNDHAIECRSISFFDEAAIRRCRTD
jgi:hypothetical protein